MARKGKASLETKATQVAVVLKAPKDMATFPVEWLDALDLWLSDNAQGYAYIIHNLDVDENGNPKRPHLHLWARLDKCQRLYTTMCSIAKALPCDTDGIEIDRATSMEGVIQYLTHQNCPEKAQYDWRQIKTSLDEEELKAVLESDAGLFSFERLVSLCARSRNLIEVIRALGMDLYECHRDLVKDVWNSSHGRA